MAPVIELLIGIIFMYLVLSLVASAFSEGLAGIFGWRAEYLERGIGSLLGNMKSDFYGHSVIETLKNPKGLWDKTRRPSYISASTFVDTTLDLLHQAAPPAAGAAPPPDPLAELQTRLEEAEATYPQVSAVLSVFARGAEDLDDFKAKAEDWFNEGMDRVSGWYKRYTKLVLFFIGVILVVVVNADTINVATYLWRDPQVRSAVAAEAASVAKADKLTTVNGQEELAKIEQLKLPLGWTANAAVTDPQGFPGSASGWLYKIVGLLLTAGALTFGGPFWFDMLKKFVGLRSSGGTPAESGGGGTAPVTVNVNQPAGAA